MWTRIFLFLISFVVCLSYNQHMMGFVMSICLGLPRIKLTGGVLRFTRLLHLLFSSLVFFPFNHGRQFDGNPYLHFSYSFRF